MGVTVPDLNDQSMQQFVQVIANDLEIKMPFAIVTKSHPDDFKVRLVPFVPCPGAATPEWPRLDWAWFWRIRAKD